MSMRTNRIIGGTGILAASAGLAMVGGAAGFGPGASADPYSQLPSQLALTGTARDFKEASAKGGHKDFELSPARGFGHYMGEAADALDEDGKPAFASAGRLVTKQWKDKAGNSIISGREYLAAKAGDVKGATEDKTGGAVTSKDTFAQWFRDVPGVNVSVPVTLTLNRAANSNIYSFDAKSVSTYASLHGFFPLNGTLFGNSGGGGYANTNYHFTYELNTEFVYKKGTGQVFTFTGDDDVLVYVDGKLVIDLGGIHGAVSQTIDLDRCNWLADGKTYKLDFFFAERHRTESNCRIDTTLQLMNVKLPASAGLYD
jgi:fibro-slime domain-containing protein